MILLFIIHFEAFHVLKNILFFIYCSKNVFSKCPSGVLTDRMCCCGEDEQRLSSALCCHSHRDKAKTACSKSISWTHSQHTLLCVVLVAATSDGRWEQQENPNIIKRSQTIIMWFHWKWGNYFRWDKTLYESALTSLLPAKYVCLLLSCDHHIVVVFCGEFNCS